MVRERKPQTGATNLNSSRSEASLDHAPSIANNSKSTASTFTRSWAHTMISPDEYAKNNLEETRRTLKMTATWKPAEVYRRDFQTVHSSSYKEHQESNNNNHMAKTTEEIAAENVQRKQREDAVDNMCKLVRTSYGTVASMLRSVKFLYYVI